MVENAEQKHLFTKALQEQCGDEDKERSQFLTERKYEEVCAVLEEFSGAADASEKKAVRKEHPQVYAWAKKYELVTFQRGNCVPMHACVVLEPHALAKSMHLPRVL